MGHLQEKQLETQSLLELYNYELSEEVYNQKLQWQKEIALHIENDKYNGELDIKQHLIYVENEIYDKYLDENYVDAILVDKVVSNNGEVYIKDEIGNIYFIDDILNDVYKMIYNAVIDLTIE